MRYQAECRFAWVLTLAAAGIAGCGGDNSVSSSETNGTLEIRTATTGVDMDPNGYGFKVDAEETQAVGTATTVQSGDLAAGDHTVHLTGLAANCVVAGENPRTVSITAGETTTVSFEVTCHSTTGGLQVSATTSGPSPDADGYSITVDGADRGTVTAGAGASLDGVPVGDHEVGLSGVAGNCRVQGDNPRSVTIASGANTSVAFTVTCDAPAPVAGTIRITTATSGPNPDANGYRFAVDGGTTQPIGINATTPLSNVAAGDHLLRLSGVASNCKVQGSNPRSVAVNGGATAEVSFAVTCSPASGSVEVRTVTTGTNPDLDGYTISVDNGAAQSVGVNATLVLPGISAGLHHVLLLGLAPNCAIPGENPLDVLVAVSATASLEFEIVCPGRPATSSWTRMSSGTTFTLEGVSGTSGTNVFAVGENLTCNTSCGQMTILHYDGTGWATQLTHEGGVEDVWAASATDAFALVTGGAFTGQVLRYNGQQWASMTPQPPPPGESAEEEPSLAAIWGTSSTDVWAVGELFVSSGIWHEYIVHYDGTQWTQMRLPDNAGQWITLHDVWGSSPTDVYAIGAYQPHDADPEESRAVILHYDGQAWTEAFRAPNSNLTLRKIWGLSRSDVYAVGYEGDRAAILHSDGQAWTPMASPITSETPGIWGSAPNDLYALPGPNRPTERAGVIWHWDGTNWTEQPTGAEDGLLDIWGSSATDIFVVGGNGTILHGP